MPVKDRKERPQKTATQALAKQEGALRKVENEATSLVTVVESFLTKGITRDNAGEAGELSQSLVRMRKEIEGTFKPIKQKIDESKKAVLDEEKRHLEPIKKAEEALAKGLAAFRLRENAERQEAERLRIAAAQAAALPPAPVAERSVSALFEDDGGPDVFGPTALAPVEEPPTKIPGVGFKDGFAYELVDMEKLRPEFILRVPDHDAIKSLVEGMGYKAEDIVGKGSIKITPTSTPIRRAG